MLYFGFLGGLFRGLACLGLFYFFHLTNLFSPFAWSSVPWSHFLWKPWIQGQGEDVIWNLKLDRTHHSINLCSSWSSSAFSGWKQTSSCKSTIGKHRKFGQYEEELEKLMFKNQVKIKLQICLRAKKNFPTNYSPSVVLVCMKPCVLNSPSSMKGNSGTPELMKKVEEN